jgi:hypothetical protein
MNLIFHGSVFPFQMAGLGQMPPGGKHEKLQEDRMRIADFVCKAGHAVRRWRRGFKQLSVDKGGYCLP